MFLKSNKWVGSNKRNYEFFIGPIFMFNYIRETLKNIQYLAVGIVEEFRSHQTGEIGKGVVHKLRLQEEGVR